MTSASPIPAAPSESRTWAQRLSEKEPILALVTLAATLRAFRLGGTGGLIGDEVWYVQAARVIAGVPVLMHHLPGGAKSGIDPNSEHPSLAKVVIAGMIRLMGDREVAWRIPSVVLGTLSVWLIYKIVLTLGGREARQQAFFAAFILTFDNMFLIHGRIATLDIYFVTFVLLATWLYLQGYLEIAAVVFGVAELCKGNAIAGLAAVMFYELLLARDRWRRPSWPAIGRRVVVIGLFLAAFLLGLGALDCYFTEYRGPFEHLAHMREYHVGFRRTSSSGTESTPFEWWLNEGAFDYYTVTAPTKHLLFRAAMNLYVIAAAPLALVYAAERAWTARSSVATFAVASVLANFLPVFLAWAIFSRASYVYYMLPLIPAMACALALLACSGPRLLRWAFVAMVLYAFVFSYPVRLFSWI
jgi:predicted membrane-bound dolichyl-phosphate-mannose-protein mannosyltransferase